MDAPYLTGVGLKLARAEHHLLNLYAAIEARHSAENENNSMTVYADMERKRINVEVGRTAPIDPAWSGIIGDAVHNLRSALDHLVCDLVLKNGHFRSCCEGQGIAFPICCTGKSFRNTARNIRGLIDPEAFALIKLLQPYIAAHSGAANPDGRDPKFSNLWILSELDIIDKHRTLILVADYHRPNKLIHSIDGQPTIVEPEQTAWRPFKDGAPIASFDISGYSLDEPHKLNMQFESEAKVFFSDTGCFDGMPVDELIPIFRHVQGIVAEFERRFFTK